MIVPVKALGAAKSRLGPQGPLLARAFLMDMLEATTACVPGTSVVVVCADPDVVAIATAAGCRVVDDSGRPGINAAAQWAAEQAGVTGPIAVLVSDLPCLTPQALARSLSAAEKHPRAFLADAGGDGTTMWFRSDGSPVQPLFGPDSAAAHRDRGDVDLLAAGHLDPHEVRTARRDVDTPEDLAQARQLGLGPRSRRVTGPDA